MLFFFCFFFGGMVQVSFWHFIISDLNNQIAFVEKTSLGELVACILSVNASKF